ncbi:MAG: SDR family oxidoreductase [Dehalococcoidia bacterium]|nr:SDR family oxidoreductase [Dehalococcoidia bacterium]
MVMREFGHALRQPPPPRRRAKGPATVPCALRGGRDRRQGQPRAYTAAKHGVIGLTCAGALDYAVENIRINAAAPAISTRRWIGRFTGGTPEGRARVVAEEPVGRIGRPEEIAAAVIWLCPDAAAFMVGHAMVIDGGQTVQ